MPARADPSRREALEAATERLVAATREGRPCRPLRDLLPDGDLDDGYEIQRGVQARTSGGRSRVGRKIGLTSEAVRSQMGVDTPDLGVLYADMAYGDSEPIPFSRLLQPRIEAEVAFVLRSDLLGRPVTTTDVRRSVDYVVPAIEVCDSRIENWDISIVDTVADNASAGVYVTGAEQGELGDIPDLSGAEMVLTASGSTVSSGSGAACMGHPVNAVVWLANTLVEHGDPLRSGELVLSGSLGPLVPAAPGTTYEATISGLGSVRAVFTDD